MGYKKILVISVGDDEELSRIADEVQAHSRWKGEFSYRLRNLIHAGYERGKITNVPRLDIFHKRRINGKSITRAYFDGDINEQEICDMYMSSKKLLEEMYRSEMLQRIVGYGIPIPQIVRTNGEIRQQ